MFTDAAMERLARPVLNLLDDLDLPHDLLTTPAGVSVLAVTDGRGGHVIDVVVLLEDGPHQIARLDPAQHGVVVTDGPAGVVVDAAP